MSSMRITQTVEKLQETANYISMKKGIETINKSQEEMKNTISEFKNTVGIKSRLAYWWGQAQEFPTKSISLKKEEKTL